ncbi:MAG: hypothetical protein ACW99A_10655 [Candidatus Kariarchaeaceae archaeon]
MVIKLALIYVSFAILVSAQRVFAEDATEGRIAEHNVVSVVALVGLLIFANIVRKSRKSNTNEEIN